MSVVDKIVEHNPDASSTCYERPTRRVALEKIRDFETIAFNPNANDSMFRAWQVENFGMPPTEVYRRMLTGRYDNKELSEDLSQLERNRYTQIPPHTSVTGRTLTIGVGSMVEIREPWFSRFVAIGLTAPTKK
ncbi:MAG: hypothetical protein ACO3JL_21875 [Myxococcota bacterium]